MAGFAGRGESRAGVRRLGGRVPVRLVTGDAQHRLAVVDLVAVTSQARLCHVCPRQGKRGLGIVVPVRWLPGGLGRMATRTECAEACWRVVRIGRIVEVGGVARRAGSWRALVDAVPVAIDAAGGKMPTGQREGGLAVIEARPLPLRCRMTAGAVGGVSRC